jgi:hypothetical protein
LVFGPDFEVEGAVLLDKAVDLAMQAIARRNLEIEES